MMGQHLLIFTLLPLTLNLGCRTLEHGADVSSLTDSELSACQFDGKRFMLIFAPDFVEDANVAQEIFLRSSPTHFIDERYAADNVKPEEIEGCLNRLRRLGKYELVGNLTNSGATWPRFIQAVESLKQDIVDFRQEKPDEEIQLLLMVSSHGAQHAGNGTIVFGDQEVPYQQFLTQLHENLMTRCLDAECSTPRGNGRMADEILIFMDNCYSGNLPNAMSTFMASKIGYGQDNQIQSADAKATRLLAFSSSAFGQTAVGTVASAKVGTLLFGLQQTLPPMWLGDNDENGFLSLAEVRHFIENDLPGAVVTGAAEQARKLAGNLICGDVGARYNTYRDLRGNPLTTQLFQNAVRYVSMVDTAGKIQQPTSYTNISEELLGQLGLAVTSPIEDGSHINDAAREYYQTLKQNLAAAKARVPAFVTITEKAMALLESRTELLGTGSASGAGKNEAGNGVGEPAGSHAGRIDQNAGNTNASNFHYNQNGSSGSSAAADPFANEGQSAGIRGPVLSAEDLGIHTDKNLMPYYAEICDPRSGAAQNPNAGNGAFDGSGNGGYQNSGAAGGSGGTFGTQ